MVRTNHARLRPTHFWQSPLFCLWGAIGSLWCCGCEQSITLIPASGLVRIDGQEVQGIGVQFLPDSVEGDTSGPSSYGSTDSNGRFTLQTSDGKPGAVAGQHVVMLVDEEEERPAQGAPPGKPSRVPMMYATVSSPLKVKITEGEEIVIEIQRQRHSGDPQ